VGYNKAASLIERMEKEGLISSANGTESGKFWFPGQCQSVEIASKWSVFNVNEANGNYRFGIRNDTVPQNCSTGSLGSFCICFCNEQFRCCSEIISLSPEQAESINKISAYMNSFKTLQGEFTQISPKGNVSKGVMFISKPGKLRFEYSPPIPFFLSPMENG
jgi:hypothetical protein